MPYNPDAEPFTPSASSTPAMEPRRARLSRLAGSDMAFVPGPIVAGPGGGWRQLEPPIAVEVGVGCAAAHSAKGPAPLPDPTRFKTTLCATVERGDPCPYDARCTFAHSEDELRSVEQNIADGITTQPALVRFQKALAQRLKKARRNRRHRELAAERAAGEVADATPGNDSLAAPVPGRRVPVPPLHSTALAADPARAPSACPCDAEVPATAVPGGGIGSAAPSGRRSATYRHDPYTSPTTQREATGSPLAAAPATTTPPPPGTPLAASTSLPPGGYSAGAGVAFGTSLPADLLNGVGGTPLCGASAPGGGSLPHPGALFPANGHGSEPPTPLADDRDPSGCGAAASDRYTPVGPGGALVRRSTPAPAAYATVFPS